MSQLTDGRQRPVMSVGALTRKIHILFFEAGDNHLPSHNLARLEASV